MNELSMSMFGSQKDYWKARAERAEGLLRDVAEVFARYGGTLCDCIDNYGQPYPSQALADALTQSREAEKAKCDPSEAMCQTMGRPRKECGCPDCGSSLIDFPSPD